ncbi:MAG: sulfite exporter TauE/SafE family protein [Planctomycetota bacterium]
MFFPTAGIETPVWLPPLVAFVISFFTSMGGVSGAFLLLPFQVSMLGYTSPGVSATNHVFNIVAIPSGVYRYWREGRMVWPLAWAVIIGTLPGVIIGAILRVAYLPDPRHFKVFAGLVLLYIGVRMVRDLLGKPPPDTNTASAERRFQELVRQHRERSTISLAKKTQALPVTTVTRFDPRRIGYDFYGEHYEVSTCGVFLLSGVVGIAGGVYGIGGGAIIAPLFVSLFGLPVYTVAGAALMGTFVTSIVGVASYQVLAPFFPSISVAPDWMLGSLFGIGGAIGMYLGARCQKRAPAKMIKWMLAATMLATASRYIMALGSL